MFIPSTKISPSSNSIMPAIALSVVVFPAPLCPMNAQICPASTFKDKLSTATLLSYFFVKFLISNI